MADQIRRGGENRFPWVTPSGGPLAQAGMSADELKIHQGKTAATPDAQPIATRGPVEFIAPTTSSDTLRLAVPAAANPFATPTGPRHDHMMVRQALTRSHSSMSQELMKALKDTPTGVDAANVGQMRASLSREHAMLGLLQGLQEMQDMIYGRIIGSQEA